MTTRELPPVGAVVRATKDWMTLTVGRGTKGAGDVPVLAGDIGIVEAHAEKVPVARVRVLRLGVLALVSYAQFGVNKRWEVIL